MYSRSRPPEKAPIDLFPFRPVLCPWADFSIHIKKISCHIHCEIRTNVMVRYRRNTMEDNEIIALYWKRMEQAITETDRKYGALCYHIAIHILSRREDAEECVSDTYLGAWNAMPPHRPKLLSAFISRITRNQALKKYEYLSADKRNQNAAVSLTELTDCLSGDCSPESLLENRRIAESISALSLEAGSGPAQYFSAPVLVFRHSGRDCATVPVYAKQDLRHPLPYQKTAQGLSSAGGDRTMKELDLARLLSHIDPQLIAQAADALSPRTALSEAPSASSAPGRNYCDFCHLYHSSGRQQRISGHRNGFCVHCFSAETNAGALASFRLPTDHTVVCSQLKPELFW